MLNKYSIDYVAMPQHSEHVLTHNTEELVHAEDFLMHLLAAGSRIQEIRHEGVVLSHAESDQLIKIAIERLAAMMLRRSLDLDTVSVIHRFGYAA